MPQQIEVLLHTRKLVRKINVGRGESLAVGNLLIDGQQRNHTGKREKSQGEN